MADIFSLNLQDNNLPEVHSSKIGKLGEKMAAEFIVRNSYALVAANFKVPVGRNRRGAGVTGEIDLIAYERDILCFIEVKTRSSDEFSAPLAAVNLQKQRQITRTARMYRKVFHLNSVKFRFDVISIVLGNTDIPKIDLFKGFWAESKFHKSNWSDDF